MEPYSYEAHSWGVSTMPAATRWAKLEPTIEAHSVYQLEPLQLWSAQLGPTVGAYSWGV